MRAIIQRVTEAEVRVDDRIAGRIGPGLLILLGIHQTDTEKQAVWLAEKCARLRIFQDLAEKMNLSVLDTGGSCLVVSQFTLYGDARKGNRPSFIESAGPDHAEPLYRFFCSHLETLTGKKTETGIFGAMMKVHLINDGPVTIWLESPEG